MREKECVLYGCGDASDVFEQINQRNTLDAKIVEQKREKNGIAINKKKTSRSKL